VTIDNAYMPSVDDIGASISCQWIPDNGLPSSFAEIGPIIANPDSLRNARALMRSGAVNLDATVAVYAPPAHASSESAASAAVVAANAAAASDNSRETSRTSAPGTFPSEKLHIRIKWGFSFV